MNMPDEPLERLKVSEGFRARPYLCPAGRVTIGYGHNLEAHPESVEFWSAELAKKVARGALRGGELLRRLNGLGAAWSREQAERQLENDLAACVATLVSACPAYVCLVEKGDTVRAGVLADMCFNMGWNTLRKFKKMFAAMERCDYNTAASEMLNSLWARQVKGRARELAECMRTGMADGGKKRVA